MCLDTVDSEVKKTKGFGWKVFKKYYFKEELYPRYKDLPYYKPYLVSVWVSETRLKRQIDSTYGGYYPTGFHIFDTHGSARAWERIARGTIRKVEYDNVVATGCQNNKDVIVARKMKILA